MKSKPLEKIWTKDFISISVTQFIVFTVFYALLTTLPIYVIQNLGESQSSAGLVVTFMLISAILVRPFSAKILDITGKRRGLIWSVVFFTVTTFVYVIVGHLDTLFGLRFVHGISFAVLTTATGAIVANTIPESRRGAGMGYFAMAMNIAIVVGPFIGLTLLQFSSFRVLFIVLDVLMIIGIICAVNVHTDEITEKILKQKRLGLKWSDLIEVKAVPVALISGLVGFAYASILSFVPIYAEELGLASTASYFFLVFAVIMVASRPYLGKAFDEKGPKKVLLPSLLIFAIGLIMLGFTQSAAMLLIAAGLIGLGYGTLLPGFQTLTIESTGRHRSGHAISTFFIFYDLGIATGAFVWGIISSKMNFSFMYLITAGLVVGVTIIFNIYLVKKAKGLTKKTSTVGESKTI